MAETVAAIYNAFLVPGESLLSLIGSLSPQTENIMRIGHGAVIYPLILSLAAWTAVLVIALLILRMIKRLLQQVSALFWTLVHAIKLYIGNLKTRLIWKYRQFFPHNAQQSEILAQEQFDDVDVAMMASISRSNTGTARSASKLAGKYDLRPAEVQKRLDRLVANHMLRSIGGTTDGEKYYRLTDSGLAFIAMCERRAKERLSLASVSVSG